MKGRNQLLQGMRGSMENMTVTQAADGDTIVKGKIVNMTNPRTAAQTAQRNLFASVVLLAQLLLPVLRLYYKPAKVSNSAYNQFVSDAVKSGIFHGSETEDDVKEHADYTRGTLQPLRVDQSSIANVNATANSVEFDVDWEFDANSPIYEGTDIVMGLAVHKTREDYRLLNPGEIRSSGTANINVPRPAEESYLVALFAVNPTTGDQSTSKAIFQVNADGTVVAWNA